MANYTFHCRNCGDFDEWHRSTKGNKQASTCPACSAPAKRVFMPPITFRMDSRVKRTIEEGMEPKLMKRNELPKVPIRNVVQKRKTANRPWQASNLRINNSK